MKTRMLTTLALGAVFLLWPQSGALAEPTPGANDSGEVDASALRELAGPDGVKVEVNLGGGLLKLLSGAIGDGDEEAAELVAGLESVRVLVMNADGRRSEQTAAAITKMADGLVRKGWQAVARVKEGGESVNVLLHMDRKDAIDGFVVLISNASDNEIVFVNITGRIDLARIAELAGHLDIEGLEEALSSHTKAGKKSKSKSKVPEDDDDDEDDRPRRPRRDVF